MAGSIQIGGRRIGPREPCFIIAEAGVNHNGRTDIALQLVDAAADAGVDAVKFQTFRAEDLATSLAPTAPYQRRNTRGADSQLAMLKALELSPEAHVAIMQRCAERNLVFFSSPFDEASVDYLDSLNIAAFKIASGEITNLDFLACVARKNRPMILSTGMARLGEVESAVRTIQATGNPSLVLLHCVSSYPADPADLNLRAMEALRAAFDLPVGYSDHSAGIVIPPVAVALSACVIEKHLTLDRRMEGPDHAASIEPAELMDLVRAVRAVEVAMGHGRKEPAVSEATTAEVARKSLIAARDIRAGSRLTADDIAVRRPGNGLSPMLRRYVVGRVIRHDVSAGAVLTFSMFS